MNPEEWQAYQAGRSEEPSRPADTAPAPHPRYAAAPPKPPKSGRLGWPMAILLLGLSLIGGCCYSFGLLIDSVASSGGLAAGPGVGVLVVENEIFGSMWVTEALDKFKTDDNIKSVVIRINSPGGAVAPCQEIYHAVKAFNKPVVVSMGSVAASGGLYIAAAGDLVMANPGTITGSIGVIMQSVEAAGTMEKLGLKSETIKSGPYKDIGSPFREMRPEERQLLTGLVTEVYEQFVADVVAGRPKMEPAEVRRLADGRIYSGAEAQKLGLVDELGGFEEALLKAAKLGGLPADKRPEVLVEDGRRPWWSAALDSKLSAPALSLPPALTPGFSLKYVYQPDLASTDPAGAR